MPVWSVCSATIATTTTQFYTLVRGDWPSYDVSLSQQLYYIRFSQCYECYALLIGGRWGWWVKYELLTGAWRRPRPATTALSRRERAGGNLPATRVHWNWSCRETAPGWGSLPGTVTHTHCLIMILWYELIMCSKHRFFVKIGVLNGVTDFIKT